MQDWITPSEPPVWAPRTRSREEFALAKSVKQFLERALPRDAVFMSIPNEGRRSLKSAGELKSVGLLTGAPDLLIVWRGRAIFIELKTKTGCLSKPQRIVHKRLLAAEAEVMLARSVEDVERGLREVGLRLRATCLAAPPTNPA